MLAEQRRAKALSRSQYDSQDSSGHRGIPVFPINWCSRWPRSPNDIYKWTYPLVDHLLFLRKQTKYTISEGTLVSTLSLPLSYQPKQIHGSYFLCQKIEKKQRKNIKKLDWYSAITHDDSRTRVLQLLSMGLLMFYYSPHPPIFF